MLRYLLAILCLALPAAADDAPAIEVSHARIVVASPMARSAAGYLEIRNDGPTTDRLVDVEADFPVVALHESVMADGIARMEARPDGFAIAPGETLALEQGGKHVMIMGVETPLSPAEPVEAVLVFETAGRVPVSFTVGSAMQDGGGHAGH